MRRLKLLLGVFLAVLIVACGGGGDPGTNSTSSTIPLFTTAPDTLTLAPGASQEFTIGGGKAPYSAASDNSAIAIVWVNGNLLDVGGVAAGTAGVTIRDSAGASVKVALSVSSSPAKVLYTTAPSSITVAIGSAWAQTYSIDGGTGPYTVTSSNTLIATVAMAGNNYIVTGVSAGTTNILIRDSAGGTVNVSVSVAVASSLPLYTTAPPSLTLGIGPVGADQPYLVGGGTGPYTATSDNSNVAAVSLQGVNLTITGLTAGSASIFVRDSAGTIVTLRVTVVGAAIVPLFTTAPPSVTIAISSTQTYGVGGGTGPYTATSNNVSVADVSLVGNSLKVTGITAGAANVVIRDSQGATVNVAVTVPAASTVPLFTTAPPSVTIAISSTQTYGVGGGTGPYTATSNNVSVADVSLVGNSLKVTGITAGAANVVIRDSQGATVNVAVTVPAASTVPLYTTAPPSVTIAIGSTQTYGVGGGTGPYTATTSNSTVADVSLVGNSLKVLGLKAGSASIVVRDAVGASTTVAVTVGLTPLSVTPNSATGIIDDILVATIVGGAPPYRASVGNILVATASIVGSDQLTIQLKQTGQTVITVLDANNQSAPYSVTSNAATPGIRLSPSVLTVSEKDNQAITLSVYGATGSISVFSSDIALLRAAVVGSKVSVTTGSNGTRCVAANTPVVITVVDSTGASALATVTIADNGTCP